MGGRSGRAERPRQDARAEATLARLASLWGVSELTDVALVEQRSLRRTRARYVVASRTIEISPRPLNPADFVEVLTHEAAHAAVVLTKGPDSPPHGPEWRRLMALAGYLEARARHPVTSPAHSAPIEGPGGGRRPLWKHACPVCHFARLARRPVRAWRCAACVAAGLPGRLEITRHGEQP